MTFPPRVRTVHYGWIIAITGALVLFSCFGLARYAYTMLLPSMQSGLGLADDRMGFIGTANFAGYLAAVLMAPILVRRFRPRPTVAAGISLIAVSMMGLSCGQSFLTVAIFYTLTGLGSGFANIPLMAMVTYWFRSKHRGKAAGLMIAGNGIGIIFAGFLVPWLNYSFGAQGWRHGWLVLGLISLGVAITAALLLRNQPSELGLEPVGEPLPTPSHPPECRQHSSYRGILFRLGILYLVFGATFMIYGTFIVTTMVREYGFSEQKAGFYWSWVGFFSLFSGIGFGTLSDFIGRKRGLALVFVVQTAAYLLAGLKLGSLGLMVSIALYGSAVFAIPAIMAAAIGDYLGYSRAATAFAMVTIFFALGQTIGPGSAGLIAKYTASFGPAYLAASLLTAGAAILAATLPSPTHE